MFVCLLRRASIKHCVHPCGKRVGVASVFIRNGASCFLFVLTQLVEAAHACRCLRASIDSCATIFSSLTPPRTTAGGLWGSWSGFCPPCSGRLCYPGVSGASEAGDFHVCRKRRRDGRLRRRSLTLQHFCVFERSTGAGGDDGDGVCSSFSTRATVRGFNAGIRLLPVVLARNARARVCVDGRVMNGCSAVG